MGFFVSRQSSWPSGDLYVEVAGGGRDYANPGMLVERYRPLGEGREYDDPREAVEAAIAICRAWRKDTRKRTIDVRVGHTGGFTMEFERGTFQEARACAKEVADALPRCAHCGEILGRESFRHDLAAEDDRFCSENCAEVDYAGYVHGDPGPA